MDCIDLRKRFGRRYRIGRDPSYASEHGPRAWRSDPWLDLILCKHGEIGPYGGEMLLACTKRKGPIAKRLAALECVDVTQDGIDGVNVKFPVDDLAAVAKVMRPRCRRQLSPEEKAELVKRLHGGRDVAPETSTHGDCAARTGDDTPESDLEPVARQRPLFVR